MAKEEAVAEAEEMKPKEEEEPQDDCLKLSPTGITLQRITLQRSTRFSLPKTRTV